MDNCKLRADTQESAPFLTYQTGLGAVFRGASLSCFHTYPDSGQAYGILIRSFHVDTMPFRTRPFERAGEDWSGVF